MSSTDNDTDDDQTVIYDQLHRRQRITTEKAPEHLVHQNYNNKKKPRRQRHSAPDIMFGGKVDSNLLRLQHEMRLIAAPPSPTTGKRRGFMQQHHMLHYIRTSHTSLHTMNSAFSPYSSSPIWDIYITSYYPFWSCLYCVIYVPVFVIYVPVFVMCVSCFSFIYTELSCASFLSQVF